MAALRFEARADGGPQQHRLGHHVLEVNAHTWRTFVRVTLSKDGTAVISIERDGAQLVADIFIEAETPRE